MSKDNNAKNLAVFSDVIMSLASDAASEVSGIEVLRSTSGKKSIRGGGVSVYFLPNDKVTIDLFVNIDARYTIPSAVSEVQEHVIKEVEGATKYRVHSVNVQVVGVNFPY